MSRSKWMRKLVGVMVASMTLSIAVLCARAPSTATTNNNATTPTTPAVTQNQEAGQVLGANRTPDTGAVAAVVPGADVPGVLGANRDRSPRTADGDNGVLPMVASIGFAGAGALAYFGKRRA